MDGQVKIIEDNEKYSILKPLTIEGLCTYFNESSWCNTSRYGKRDFSGFNKEGGVIYIFHYKENDQKTTFARTGFNDILTDDLSSKNLDYVQHFIWETFGIKKNTTRRLLGSNIFNTMRKFLRGEVSERFLESSDPLIYDIRKKDGEYYIILSLEDEDKFFELIGLNEDDISFLRWVNSSNGYTFRETDSDYEEMKEGYGPFRLFNDDNTEKMKKLGTFFLSNKKFDLSDSEYAGELFIILYEHYPRQMDEIIYEYNDATNTQATESARKTIDKELNNYFEKNGIDVSRGYSYPQFKIIDLISFYSYVGNTKYSLKEILEERIIPSENLGGWYENQYDFENSGEFDLENLNRQWGWQLDKILDYLDESDSKVNEYYKLWARINDKFKFFTAYQLPKDKDVTFKIKGIDKDTLKIKVEMIRGKSYYLWTRHEFTEDDFYKFLYQPELFKLV